MKRIFLIRHGQSQANVDKTLLLHTPDHAIGLSDDGVQQAVGAGKWLETYFTQVMPGVNAFDKFRMWVSPYKRTQQTAQGLMTALGGKPNAADRGGRTPAWCDVLEHDLLCEQQFGLFDGILDEDLPKQFPNEYQHYKKCEDFNGRYWARMPLGESRFDVVQRVHQAFGTFHRDEDRHGINNLIVVSHGVTLRAFVKAWCHKSIEWFESEPNPKNCSIRLIEEKTDCGYIFSGFDKIKH